MRVRVKSWRGTQEMELSRHLTPRGESYGEGALESQRAAIEATAEALGRLLERLVENRTITLDEAQEIAGQYGDVEEIKEH